MSLSALAKEGRINPRASTRDSQSIIINAPIGKIWEIMLDIDNWPNWNSDIIKVQTSEIKEDETFIMSTNNSRSFTCNLELIEPNTTLSWTSSWLWLKAIQVWKFEKTEEYQTIVTVEESMQGFLIPLFISHYRLHFSLIHWLDRLKKKAES